MKIKEGLTSDKAVLLDSIPKVSLKYPNGYSNTGISKPAKPVVLTFNQNKSNCCWFKFTKEMYRTFPINRTNNLN